ncbi:MAG: hypothetical protein ACLTYN_02160 [Dysosmobacter welbionis]
MGSVQVTGENGQKQDLVVTLTGTDTEGTVESPVGMTISGLPKQNAERSTPIAPWSLSQDIK